VARQEGFRLAIKRCIDVGCAVGLLLGTAPVIALAALSIRATMDAPVLFRQRRPGKHGVPFTVYKFRTMRAGDGADAERLTPLGRLLRATSVDELPQLVNVVLGQMSLVGPRPLLMEYLERYSLEQARRHQVLPGITGWAQVHGRNALTHEQRFELDVWYVDHWSIGLDLWILVATLGGVLSRRGISAPGHATMPVFRGEGATGGRAAHRNGTEPR
jgi:lipopolysaccharide/colanic/teichoic acid biosynthesis glycosyltransferase